jgi:hypothetical protein
MEFSIPIITSLVLFLCCCHIQVCRSCSFCSFSDRSNE